MTVNAYPVPPVESLKVERQNAPCVSAGVNVLNSLQGQRPKATDVSPWYGVYATLKQVLQEFTLPSSSYSEPTVSSRSMSADPLSENLHPPKRKEVKDTKPGWSQR